MKLILFICIFCVSLVTYGTGKRIIPPYVKLCKQSDVDISRCLLDSVAHLSPYLAKGIPEMKIVPFDPLHVAELNLQAGENFHAHFTDMNFYKVHLAEFKHLQIDFENNTMEVRLFLPTLKQYGNYSLQGRLLIFDLNGSGWFQIDWSNVAMDMKLKGERIMKKGEEYLHFTDIDLKLKLGGGHIQLDDLFKNNPELTARTNEVLNENAATILHDLEPLVADAMSSVMLSVAQNVYDSFPINVLHPK